MDSWYDTGLEGGYDGTIPFPEKTPFVSHLTNKECEHECVQGLRERESRTNPRRKDNLGTSQRVFASTSLAEWQTDADTRAQRDMMKTVHRRPDLSPIMEPIRRPTSKVRNGKPIGPGPLLEASHPIGRVDASTCPGTMHKRPYISLNLSGETLSLQSLCVTYSLHRRQSRIGAGLIRRSAELCVDGKPLLARRGRF